MTASNHLRLLITGGSRGIGLAIAKRFSELGHSTTLLATTESTLDTASKALSVLNPRQKHCYIVGDVASQATWDNVKANHKDIDVLISAAGLSQSSFLPSTSPDIITSILKTNLLGAILGARTISSLLIRRRSPGCIINISSVLGGHITAPGTTVYAASKAGLTGFSNSLAAELGKRGIRSNVVSPGYVETDMTRNLKVEGKRYVKMEDVVRAVEMMVTGDANGEEVLVVEKEMAEEIAFRDEFRDME